MGSASHEFSETQVQLRGGITTEELLRLCIQFAHQAFQSLLPGRNRALVLQKAKSRAASVQRFTRLKRSLSEPLRPRLLPLWHTGQGAVYRTLACAQFQPIALVTFPLQAKLV